MPQFTTRAYGLDFDEYGDEVYNIIENWDAVTGDCISTIIEELTSMFDEKYDVIDYEDEVLLYELDGDSGVPSFRIRIVDLDDEEE